MALTTVLQQIGWDEKKTRVYLAALELGSAKAFAIAKKSGVERPTTYDVLAKLTEEGLASFYEKRGVRYYTADSPEKILRSIEEKKRVVEGFLPELRSIENTLKEKPKIKFYDGLGGIKTILEDTLTTPDRKLRGILSVVDLFKIPGKEFMKGYVEQRIKGNIHLRVVRSRQKELKEYWPTDPTARRELRYAPPGMVFSMTMFLYAKKVALISSQKETFGMIIENAELNETMGHLFEALWQVSQPT